MPEAGTSRCRLCLVTPLQSEPAALSTLVGAALAGGDIGEAIFEKSFELAAWWSSIFVIPAIVMGGSTIASVRQAAVAGIEFVALSRAVFAAADPAAAVAEANRLLAETPELAS